MEGRGRSRRRSLRREWKRRLSSVLAVVLTAVMILNMPLSIDGLGLHVSDAFASGSNADQEDSVWATASNAKYRQGDSQDVDIYVIANDSGAVPGNTTSMTLYLKNNTDQAISEGVLTFSGKYINKEDASFQDVGSGEEYSQIITAGGPGYSAEESGEGLIYQETDKTALLADETAEDVSVTETEAEAEQLPVLPEDPGDGEAEEEESEEAYKLENIDLQPGELHEVYFEFYTEDDVKSTKANVSFSFRGENEEGSRVTGDTKFYYSIGLPNVNFSMEDGMQIESGVKNDLEIWMSEPDWVDEDLEERLQEQEEKKAQEEMEQAEEEAEEDGNTASGSDASRATDSNASKDNTASNSNAAKDDTSDGTLSKEDAEKIDKYTEEAMEISESRVSYTVEIFGAKYSDFHPRKTEEAEDIGWISCVYEVDRETEPGIYYGKVTAAGKWNKKDFTTEQGFLFEVTGEGKTGQEFTEELDNVIVHAYAEEGVLPENVQLKATELIENDAETGDQFQTAKDALDAEGTQYDGMMALDITFIDENGEEIEPDGEVQVSIEMKEGVLPEDVDLSTVEVHHLKEVDENTVEVEAVADGADKTDGTVKSADEVVAEMEDAETPEEEIEAAVSSDATAVASFSVGSFSSFVITWSSVWFSTYLRLEVTAKDKEGTDLSSLVDDSTITINSTGTFSFADYAAQKEVDGYTYVEARYNGTIITNFVLSSNNMGLDRTVSLLNSEGDSVVSRTYDRSSPIELAVDFIYVRNAVSISDTIDINGQLNAIVDTAVPDGATYTYRWEKSTNGLEGSWEEIVSEKITGDLYNTPQDPAERTWVNVALDDGARMYYRVTVTATDSNGAETVIGTSNAYQVPYYDELQNGGFETPNANHGSSWNGSRYTQFDNGTEALYWRTTGSDGAVEIIGDNPYNAYNFREFAEGDQAAELNAEAYGSLYQDVLTVPGSTLYWHLAHRGRDGAESMRVVIMSAPEAIAGNITTQEAVQALFEEHPEYFQIPDGQEDVDITDDRHAWKYYQGQYQVPDGQYVTRFFFVSMDGMNSTHGNLLDDVWFSTEIPDPLPDTGNLTIEKIVSGLPNENIANYKINITISDNNSYNQTIVFGDMNTQFTPVGDGTYRATRTLQNMDLGTYEISEEVPEEVAESLSDYNVTSTVDGGNGTKKTISVIANETTTINFRNEYTRKTGSLVVKKLVSGNMSDTTDDFDFVLILEKAGELYTADIKGNGNVYKYQQGLSGYKEDALVSGYVFQLSHNEEIAFEVPYGYEWTVVEKVPAGYTGVSYVIDSGTTISNSYTAFGTVSGANTVTFTNTKTVNTPTGIVSERFPYLMMLAIAAIGATSFVYPTCRRRRHKGDR